MVQHFSRNHVETRFTPTFPRNGLKTNEIANTIYILDWRVQYCVVFNITLPKCERLNHDMAAMQFNHRDCTQINNCIAKNSKTLNSISSISAMTYDYDGCCCTT